MEKALRIPGDIHSLTHQDSRVLAEAGRGVLEVSTAPLGALRVRIGRRKTLPPDTSWAVREPELAPALRMTKFRGGVRLTPSGPPSLEVDLLFKPGRLSFRRPGGSPF